MRIDRVQAFAYLAPAERPVQTSFGTMTTRPAIFVCITDEHGMEGWGEIWCNYPPGGAAYKRSLVDQIFAPLLTGRQISDPRELFIDLTRRTAVLAIQCGEPGPIAHCIAGIDLAVWDLVARRSGQPLWRLLGGRSPAIKTYASGINPAHPELVAAALHDQGYRAFKLKVGFGEELDLRNLRAMREQFGQRDASLMADANQGWDLPTAHRLIAAMHEFDLDWIEEPLRADMRWEQWLPLRKIGVPLAAGENLAGDAQFDMAIEAAALSVIQPDMAKWGGFSGCYPVAKRILDAGQRYCPHFLGGGIGLLASAHLLAGVGGDGMLEVDANPNVLRTLVCGPLTHVEEGRVRLDDTPGLGIVPDMALLQEYLAKT